MPFRMIRDDITRLRTDAIVNAANADLKAGGGVCGAIFTAAGCQQLQNACRSLAPCPTGSAVITPGFALPARYVIHAVGPIWSGGHRHERELLAACYRSALRLAVQYELQSIAFPLISGGIYGYPKAEAIRVAVETIRDFLADDAAPDLDVVLVLFDPTAYLRGTELYGSISSYITDEQVPQDTRRSPMLPHAPSACAMSSPAPVLTVDDAGSAEDAPLCDAAAFNEPAPQPIADLASYLRQAPSRETTFSQHLLTLIDRTGEKDAAVYKRANLDRRLFSKIRSNADYQPSKSTVMALCLALRLPRDEADLLLSKAGYALTAANPRDLAVMWCIDHRQWDVFELNMVLFEMDLPGLGA